MKTPTLWKSNIVKEKSVPNKIYIQFWSTSKYITDLRHAKLNSANCWFIQRQIFINSAVERDYKGRDTKSRRFVARAKRWRNSLENFEEIVTAFLEFDSSRERKRKRRRGERERRRRRRRSYGEKTGLSTRRTRGNFFWSSWLDYNG